LIHQPPLPKIATSLSHTLCTYNPSVHNLVDEALSLFLRQHPLSFVCTSYNMIQLTLLLV
jgi:hypothetical protein